MTQSLYQRILGAEYSRLPSELADFHAVNGRRVFVGRARVKAAEGLFAKAIARLAGLPLKDAEVDINFTLLVDGLNETWVRDFGNQQMVSELHYQDGKILEHLGLMSLISTLSFSGGILCMKVEKVRFLRVFPAPRWMMPNVVANEFASPGRLNFDVRVGWGMFGRLVEYSGFLGVSDG